MCWYDSCASFRWRGKKQTERNATSKEKSEEPIGNADSEQLIIKDFLVCLRVFGPNVFPRFVCSDALGFRLFFF